MLGVLAADCGPILFADPENRVIGAAHAGWKGALTGVLENTIAAMEALGANRDSIVACLGPSISQASYEVGPEFVDRFITENPDYERFFIPSANAAPRHVRPAGTDHRTVDPGRRASRKPRPLHLSGQRALLFLSPDDTSQGAGLRPPDFSDINQGDLSRMALHFEKAEFASRLARLTEKMKEEKLDALLLFAQESMYWLTGYDTFGYCFFQTLIVKSDGTMALITRSADLRQAKHTSVLDDIHIWVDRVNADPTLDLKNLLVEMDLLGTRIGVEYDTHGMTGRVARLLDAQLTTFGQIVDASYLVSRLRLIKSPTEIAYVERAAALADDALDAAIRLTKPGADEADILAAMQGAIFSGGRRLSRQRVHHRFGGRRAALPLQGRPPQARRQ